MGIFDFGKRKEAKPRMQQVRIYIITSGFLLDMSNPDHDRMGKEIYEYALGIFKKQPEFLKHYISSLRFNVPHKMGLGTAETMDEFDNVFTAWQEADGVPFGEPNKSTFILSGDAHRREGDGVFKWQVYANFVE